MYNLLYNKYQNLIPYVNERRVIRFYQGLVLYKANMWNYIQIISKQHEINLLLKVLVETLPYLKQNKKTTVKTCIK